MSQLSVSPVQSQSTPGITGRSAARRPAHSRLLDSGPCLALADTRPERTSTLLPSLTPAESSDDRLIAAQFGNFRVMRKLSEGGMGLVYEAWHPTIERRAVVKVLRPRYAENADYARRFLNEARVVNIIRHPGLVEIFDYGQLADGTLFIVMEYLEGESLHEKMVGRRQPWGEKEVLHLALQLAQALTAAHEKGVIHRDLKPHNIMVVACPIEPAKIRVKVIDFGLATVGKRSMDEPSQGTRMTQSGVTLGTPMYMAPEQFGQARCVDGRADTFSLGVILYELLAGNPPYRGTAVSLLEHPAPRLERVAPLVSAKMATLVHQMIAGAATDRPLMAEVVSQLAALQHLASGSPAMPSSRRQPLLHTVVGAAALVVLGLAMGPMLRSAPRLSAQERHGYRYTELTDVSKGRRLPLAVPPLLARVATPITDDLSSVPEDLRAPPMPKDSSTPSPPAQADSQLLPGADLQAQLVALDALSELPPDRALPLLYIASRDATAAIRRRAAELAAGFYRRTANAAFLDLLRRLRHDHDSHVRSTVGELPHERKAVSAVAGLGGAAQHPHGSAEQLLHEGVQAVESNRLGAAQHICGRLRTLAQHGHVKRSLLPDVSLVLGRFYEKRLELEKARREYRKLREMDSLAQRPDIRSAVQSALTRLGG